MGRVSSNKYGQLDRPIPGLYEMEALALEAQAAAQAGDLQAQAEYEIKAEIAAETAAQMNAQAAAAAQDIADIAAWLQNYR